MIRDVVIIKDGMPIYSKSSSLSSTTLFSNQNNLLMISGFFSALNSFSDQFDGLGTIKELKLSKTDLKLSFFKDKSIPNLIFLATYDNESDGTDVQRTLKRLSNTFMRKYNIEQILKWSGRVEAFKSFESIVNDYINKEQEERESNFKDKVIDLFNEVQDKIEYDEKTKSTEKKNIKIGQFIPKINVSGKVNPNCYLSDRRASTIFNKIDGIRSISEISKILNLEPSKVFNCCKSLLKMNFIKFEST